MGLSLRGQTSGAVDINAPAVAGDNTITLPGGNGSANQFYKNSTTAGIVTHSSMVENASGDVGIGTTNPSQVLHVDQGNVLINNNGTASSLIITTDTNRDANIYFGDSDSDSRGRIRYNNSADYVSVFSAGDERLRITSAGGVGVNTTSVSSGVNVAVGGTIRVQDTTDATQYLTITHQGVDFQNTGVGNSTSATAHLLDDYEEGSWTFLVTPGGGSYQYNYGQTGYYRKIGSLVFVNAWIHLTVSSAVSGDITISGLPFICHSTSRNWIPVGGYNHSSGPASSGLWLVLTNGTSTASLLYNDDQFGGATNLDADNLPTAAELYINGCYIAA